MNGISIRRVRPNDVPVIAALLDQLARRYITAEFTRSAEEKFLRSNDETSIRAFITSGFEYWVAERCDAIIGFVGVRDHSHLYHLFVAECEQNRGVARALWQTAEGACRVAGNLGRFTVNSSNNAVGVYESFGFVRAGQPQNSDGVLFNPMVLEDAG
jgi:ribosomal protein S18 acetylase RimI-like enzyme